MCYISESINDLFRIVQYTNVHTRVYSNIPMLNNILGTDFLKNKNL